MCIYRYVYQVYVYIRGGIEQGCSLRLYWHDTKQALWRDFGDKFHNHVLALSHTIYCLSFLTFQV